MYWNYPLNIVVFGVPESRDLLGTVCLLQTNNNNAPPKVPHDGDTLRISNFVDKAVGRDNL